MDIITMTGWFVVVVGIWYRGASFQYWPHLDRNKIIIGTLWENLSIPSQQLDLDPSILQTCRTFYSTTRTVTIMASMPHTPILKVCVVKSIATFAAWQFDCQRLYDIMVKGWLAGACIFTTKKSPSTRSLPSCMLRLVPTIAFLFFLLAG